MLPPAPVISTVLPRSVSAMPDFVELHRLAPQQVFGLDLAHVVDAWLPSRSSSADGTVSTGRPVVGGQLERPRAARRRRSDGMATIRCVAAPSAARARITRRAARAPARRAMRAPCLAGSSSSKPEHDPALLVDAGQQQPRRLARAQHHARGGSRASLPVMRARACARTACGTACAPAPAVISVNTGCSASTARGTWLVCSASTNAAPSSPGSRQATASRLPRRSRRSATCPGAPAAARRRIRYEHDHDAQHHPDVVARPRARSSARSPDGTGR